MSVVTYATGVYRKLTRAHYINLMLIILAVAALLAMGFFLGRHSAAATIRDCSENSIDKDPEAGGGCGAVNATELCTDMTVNKPGDLQAVYGHFGLNLADCKGGGFAMGEVTRQGNLVVDGQTVMTGVWTMGRTTLGGKQPTAIQVGSNTYYHSAPEASFGDDVQSISAIVLFDGDGTVQAAVLGSCGNPVTKGEKVVSSAECKKLNKTPVKGKKNTYSFTTEVALAGHAQVVKVDYYIDEGSGPVLFKSEPKQDTPVVKEFTKDAKVIAKVTVALPGKKSRVVESEACTQIIEVAKKEVPPKPVPEKPQPKPEQPTPTPKPQPQVQSATVVQATPQPLPVTGPADAAGLFVGTSLAGAIGHRLYMAYRSRSRREK